MTLESEAVKVGALIPTYNRPDAVRHCVLQLLHQSRPPDLICVHQNGSPDNYNWCIEDLSHPIIWIHTPVTIPQHEWYLQPILRLLEEDCTHYFWTDHDDLYLANHVQESLSDLDRGYDFRISNHCDVLIMKDNGYRYYPSVLFDIHKPGGMSSSMAFNRRFAIALTEDIAMHADIYYTDWIVANHTMPKFRCYCSSVRSTVYVSHSNSVSSPHWLDIENPQFKKFSLNR
ncbi:MULTISPECIES: glycosyltransferase family 2 protein [Paraburkholderia]|uniref:glycosyltransferase family 2 protein n=1 Tax=Paraburkholderia TaxID=1822464 RepID=UPI003462133E